MTDAVNKDRGIITPESSRASQATHGLKDTQNAYQDDDGSDLSKTANPVLHSNTTTTEAIRQSGFREDSSKTTKINAVSDLLASQPACVRDLAHVQAIVKELLSELFPEISHAPLDVVIGQTNDYTSFHSRPNISSILTPWKKTRYLIVVSPNILQKMPVDVARDVLIHELVHTLFFITQQNGLWYGLQSLWDPAYQRVFERATDLEAIRRGAGPGLIEYIRWFYPQLPPKLRAKKTDMYLTIADIKAAMENPRPDHPLWKEHHAFWSKPRKSWAKKLDLSLNSTTSAFKMSSRRHKVQSGTLRGMH